MRTSPQPNADTRTTPVQDPALLPARAQKGRGAVSNANGRFEKFSHHAWDDGWQCSTMNTDINYSDLSTSKVLATYK
jgi:hypothetical protein|tara:strand:+ start:67629 stop:67859 length:231 start_codon:yes stop_codon:yes gene_type:complete